MIDQAIRGHRGKKERELSIGVGAGTGARGSKSALTHGKGLEPKNTLKCYRSCTVTVMVMAVQRFLCFVSVAVIILQKDEMYRGEGGGGILVLNNW